MNLFERAKQLQEETISHRRWLHQTAEVGLHMPKTAEYVTQALRETGLEPKPCGEGVMAELGTAGKLLLLRADMDALPMEEQSGLDFACTTGNAHTCGHDCHCAMLLTAAKLLKEREKELKGRVRLVFQPGEEPLIGAKNMIDHGILEPKPDAAMALHLAAGPIPPGVFMCSDGEKAMMFSVGNFEIRITGKGAHGAYPHLSVDPINIGVHIHLALQSLLARETDPEKACILTIGQFQAGTAGNIIPQTALLRGTVRTDDPAAREQLIRRVEEICIRTAEMYGGSAEVVWSSQIPPLICHAETVKAMVSYVEELPIPGLQVHFGARASASEDFALVAEQVPAAYFYVSAGYADERGKAIAHQPAVLYNEDALPMGAAAYAHCAMRWLEENA